MSRRETSNLSEHLTAIARLTPDRKAAICPLGKSSNWVHLTYAELDREVNRYSYGLVEAGIGKGTTTILMMRPSLEFFCTAIALLRVGAKIVLIDPGMGIRRMACSLSEVEAEAFIGIPLAHMMRVIYHSSFRTVKVNVTAGRRWFWGGRGGQPRRTHVPRRLLP